VEYTHPEALYGTCDAKNGNFFTTKEDYIMGLTAQQAEEYRQSILQRQKDARKERVDEIVARSISIEDAEKRLRELITDNPEQSYFGIYVLDTVTNDWDDKNKKKIVAEVQEELAKKYDEAFPDAEVVETNAGNQRVAFRLTMRLS
jgi:hypothetical protein